MPSVMLLPLLLSAVQAPSTAMAQVETFTISGVSLQMPIPAGYCRPSGGQVDAVRMQREMTTGGTTHFALFRCDGQDRSDRNYIIVTTPGPLLGATITRAQMMSMLGATLGRGPLADPETRRRILQRVGETASRAIGSEVHLDGEIGPLGVDDVCGYLGGVAHVRSASETHDQAAGGCISTAGGRAFSIISYSSHVDSNGVAALLVQSRRLAEQVRVAAPAR